MLGKMVYYNWFAADTDLDSFRRLKAMPCTEWKSIGKLGFRNKSDCANQFTFSGMGTMVSGGFSRAKWTDASWIGWSRNRCTYPLVHTHEVCYHKRDCSAHAKLPRVIDSCSPVVLCSRCWILPLPGLSYTRDSCLSIVPTLIHLKHSNIWYIDRINRHHWSQML